MPFIVSIAVVVFLIIAAAIRILKEYERGVIFRLGRLIGAKGPGLIILIPFIDKMVKTSLRTVVMDVPPQDVITKDNVSVQVNAVIYFRVINPESAIVEVETTLRSIVGQVELDELLGEREKINHELQKIIDNQSDPWGIKVSLVEVKHIDLPLEMKRAMAKQAEAERERRAKVINAEGEFQASERLSQAAGIISKYPVAIQLRFLQTLTEVSAENNSTTIFPVPIDLFRPFIESMTKKTEDESQ
jgi:regulator of protease activity HflC (stomatin/prohibitin superfamily)